MVGRKRAAGAQGRGQERDTLSATEAQNNFGEVLQRVAADGVVYITKYDRPTAVILSPGRYRELVGEDAELEQLEREFDEMLARMQTAEAGSAADALFELGPEALAAAAVRAAHGAGDD